mmetsp:Transcript_2250/g.4820  ORF Transcript_2250/g.4820 Transcript_2250/m.4820 type:complete len:229 (+) Transcript_2250:3123-3809(+)
MRERVEVVSPSHASLDLGRVALNDFVEQRVVPYRALGVASYDSLGGFSCRLGVRLLLAHFFGDKSRHLLLPASRCGQRTRGEELQVAFGGLRTSRVQKVANRERHARELGEGPCRPSGVFVVHDVVPFDANELPVHNPSLAKLDFSFWQGVVAFKVASAHQALEGDGAVGDSARLNSRYEVVLVHADGMGRERLHRVWIALLPARRLAVNLYVEANSTCQICSKQLRH